MWFAKNFNNVIRQLSIGTGAKLTVALFIVSICSMSIAQPTVGGKPLFDAAKSGDVEAVRRYLDRGASPDERDWADAPLVLRAACHGRLDVIRLLVARGADVNARQGDDWTAIFCAARYDELATVEFLIESGANLTLRDEDGDSIAETARQGEAWRVLRLLDGDATRLVTPDPAELSCDELSRYIKSKITGALSASLEQESDAETKAAETRDNFMQVGALGARGHMKNCAGDDFSAPAGIDFDSLPSKSCKDLRLGHAMGIQATVVGQKGFERAVGTGNSDEEQSAFLELMLSAQILGTLEEVISERRCRPASSAEIEMFLEAQRTSDSMETFDPESAWDAIDQGDATASRSAATTAQAGETASRCPRMGFHVEDGHLLKETGLRPKIADLVRVRLRAARLYEPMPASSRGTSPHLAVRVSLPSYQTNHTAASFVFSTEITFYQQPAGARELHVEAAWIGGDSGVGSTSKIANEVLKHLDRFISEYKAANPGCAGP